MDSKHMMKASILDKLIEKLMGGEFDPKEEMTEDLGQDPKAEMKMLSIEAKPEGEEETDPELDV